MVLGKFNEHIMDFIIPTGLVVMFWYSATNLLNVAAAMFLPSGWGQTGVALFEIALASVGLYVWNGRKKNFRRKKKKKVEDG